MRLSPLFILLLLLSACKPDPCANRNCQNGGTCIEGECQCPDGFIGPDCATALDPCFSKACDANRTLRCDSLSITEARCVCREGFEGEICDKDWTDKFVGTYLCDETCDGVLINFAMQVEEGPDFNRITLINFSNRPGLSGPSKVVGRMIDPTVFEIYEQFMPYGAVSGAGQRLADGKIEMVYSIIKGTDTLRCEALLSR